MVQHGADLIGLQAVGQLRNERHVTALFRFEPDPQCEIGPVTCREANQPGGLTAEVPVLQQESWYVIAPGDEAAFNMVWWQPASAWAEAWPQRVRSSESSKAPPTTTVRLVVRGASGDAVDRCDLTFGGYVVAPHPREDGWVIAITDPTSRNIPGTAPERVAQVGLMLRSYPGLFRRRANWNGHGK
jgi:hypothetical protein